MSDSTDKRLDQLLNEAEWPVADDQAVQRLQQHWQTLEDEAELDSSTNSLTSDATCPKAAPQKIAPLAAGTRSIPNGLIALACMLLIAGFAWIAFKTLGTSSDNSPDPIAKQKSATDQKGSEVDNSEPKQDQPGSIVDKNFAQSPPPQATIPQPITPEPELVTQADLFAAVSRVQNRRRNRPDATKPSAKKPNSVLDRGLESAVAKSRTNKDRRKQQLAEKRKRRQRRSNDLQIARLLHPNASWLNQSQLQIASTWLGKQPTAALLTQRLIQQMDSTFVGFSRDKEITPKQLGQYQSMRRAWENWAWQFASSGKSTNRLASTRFAIAVSTSRSLNRIQRNTHNAFLRDSAVLAICRFGNTQHIQSALVQIGAHERLQKQLLTAMLGQNNRQAGLLFLEYMKDPKTSEVALQIANSTDQLPTTVWLESIAQLDATRWDAALAVANVCDRRVTEGLITMAMEPTTSSTALIALMKSSCSDAQRFIAFAETDQQMTGGLMMARRRMKQMDLLESNNMESRQSSMGLSP